MTAPTPGQEAYEAYRFVAGGKSLVTGATLPAYEQLPATIQLAWDGAAQAAIDWQRAEDVNPTAEDYDHAADVIAGREPQPAPGTHRHAFATGPCECDETCSCNRPQPAPELAALRELLGEIGTMAANAPEDGDSFGLLEEIAMMAAGFGVPEET